MDAIYRSRASSATMVGVLLVLTATSAGASTSTHSLSPGPSAQTGLPILRLAGGPPRSFDNVWLGLNEQFLEVNAGLTHILPDGRITPDLAIWTLS